MSRCKSCGAPIKWGKTVEGKNIPLNPEKVTIAYENNEGKYAVVTGHVSHFATCPNADQHRKSR